MLYLNLAIISFISILSIPAKFVEAKKYSIDAYSLILFIKLSFKSEKNLASSLERFTNSANITSDYLIDNIFYFICNISNLF